MPFESHEVFNEPEDRGAKIWRYMSFAKFVSVLNDKALYFSSANELAAVDLYERSIAHMDDMLENKIEWDMASPEEWGIILNVKSEEEFYELRNMRGKNLPIRRDDKEVDVYKLLASFRRRIGCDVENIFRSIGGVHSINF